MSYLTEEEKKMPNDVRVLQLVLGLQTCKTKKDAGDLIKEAQELAIEDYKKRVKNIIEKLRHRTIDGKLHLNTSKGELIVANDVLKEIGID